MAGRRKYAELHAHSSLSFLRGANDPEDLVESAVELGLSALALTDINGLASAVKLARAASAVEGRVATVFGSELTLGAGLGAPRAGEETLIVLARNHRGYHRLSHLISQGLLASEEKGKLQLTYEQVGASGGDDFYFLTSTRSGALRRALEPREGQFDIEAGRTMLARLREILGKDRLLVEVVNHQRPLDSDRCALLGRLARELSLPTVATGAVRCAAVSDGPLSDVLEAVRRRSALADIPGYLSPSPAFMRSPAEMAVLHKENPQAVERAGEIGEECAFDLALIAPQLPPFPTPEGHSEASWLRHVVNVKGAKRYGERTEASAREAWEKIDHELAIIEELGFPGYFLIVHEIVEFCAERGIWCQGRGSAANSAVCYALGITAVDAVRHKMLFERFLSPGRSGPPDIDVDIESGRREEVIQHVYARYGRAHAAQVANVITYRARSAVRDAARAFGYDAASADTWARAVRLARRERRPSDGTELIRTSGIPTQVAQMAHTMIDLPRHLGIHSGGMVMCSRPVTEICPVGWASMPGRTVLQWDKDDCADAGLVKFDLLGLGMLTALRHAFTDLAERGEESDGGKPLDLHTLPQDDERVYDLLCAAETVGVFQVESRAQMATLPRLRPRCFYDLVIEVALIRPGPIQGGAVNPYIRRRRGREPVTYLHPLLRPALEKTLGIPLFQEQLMQIAIDAAGVTPAQADRLRKAMGAKRSHKRMDELREMLISGMRAKGISLEVAEQIFSYLRAFADFGFPESHSFSFAYLVYASAWLKVHYPEQFYMGLLAAQPMGFYSRQTLVHDARRFGVRITRAEVNFSNVHPQVITYPADINSHDDAAASQSTPEVTPTAAASDHPLVFAHRDRQILLGLKDIRGIGQSVAERIVSARHQRPFTSLSDLARRAQLSASQLENLATAGAVRSLSADRRAGIWAAGPLGTSWGSAHQPTLPGLVIGHHAPPLPAMSEQETMVADVWAAGTSPQRHPMSFIRHDLTARDISPIAQLPTLDHPRRVWTAGVVTHRQRPPTAGGLTFLSLEDESGLINVVVHPPVWKRYRAAAAFAPAVVIRGMTESGDGALNVIAEKITALSVPGVGKSRDWT